jgi:hypothetical protein
VESRVVHGHSVVADVTTDDRAQPPTLLRNGVMHAPSKLGFHLAQLRLQSLTNGLPQDREVRIAPLSRADVRESEEVKGLRFALPAPAAILGRERPEFQQPGLVRMQPGDPLTSSLGLSLGLGILPRVLVLDPMWLLGAHGEAS